jgi:hypothetical protein
MRQYFAIFVALLVSWPAEPGVRRVGGKDVEPQQSAALFVGIRDFKDRSIAPVPYAMDDAIDLAYEMAIAQHLPLVPASKVVLALSDGQPRKRESATRLKALLEAGARRRAADQVEVLRQVELQSRRVGAEGILILSFATHGVSRGGVQRLLVAGSSIDYPESMITEPGISDMVERNDVPRALILIDACRERLTRDRRDGTADQRSRSAFAGIMSRVEGQAVIFAAAGGGYAYDDDARHNGVFTAAVIDGLHCGAGKDRHGFITVETLYKYVSTHVLRWVRSNKNTTTRMATQLSVEGEMRRMPLAVCGVRHTASMTSSPAE